MPRVLHCSVPSIPAGNVTTAQAASPGTLSTCSGTQPWEEEHPSVPPFRVWAVNMQGLHSLDGILKGGRVVSPALFSWWRPQSTDGEVSWGLSLSFAISRCWSTNSLGWKTATFTQPDPLEGLGS